MPKWTRHTRSVRFGNGVTLRNRGPTRSARRPVRQRATKVLLRTAPKMARPVAVKRKFQSGAPVFSGMGTMSRWISKGRYNPKARFLKYASGVNKFVFNGTQRLECPDGRQNAISMLYYDQSPLQTIFAGLGSALGNATSRIFHQNATGEYTFTNTANTVSYVSIYDLHFKRDMDATDAPDTSPEGAWQAGEIMEGNSLGLSIVGSYPTRTKNFNDYYKVARKSTHMIRPGEVHKHKVFLGKNKYISKNVVNDSCRYRAFTSAVMFVITGTPIDNVGATVGTYDVSGNVHPSGAYDVSGNMQDNVTTGVVTTSPCSLDIVWSVNYVYRWMSDIDNDIVTSNNLTTGNNLEVMMPTGIAYPFDAA